MELRRTCEFFSGSYPEKKPLLDKLLEIFATLWEQPPSETFDDSNHHYCFDYVQDDMHLQIVIGFSIRPIIAFECGVTRYKFNCFEPETLEKEMKKIADFIAKHKR